MRKALLALASWAAVGLLPASPARAVLVTYSTAGYFNSNPGQASVTSNQTASVTFVGQASNTVDPGVFGLTVASFGEFRTAATGRIGTFVDVPFTLQITQTAPTGGSGSFTSYLRGQLTSHGSTLHVTFDAGTVTIGDTTYTLDRTHYVLVPPSSHLGSVTIEGTVASAPIGPAAAPEPSTLAMAGTAGLFGLLAWRRRRAPR